MSGGGYIGSWLSALVARKRENPSRPPGRTAVDEVTDVLARLDGRSEDPEKIEIRQLREYSNYLTPRAGVFSADTFTLGATAVRNVLLNGLTLVPLLTAVLLVPAVYGSALAWCGAWGEAAAPVFALAAAGALCLSVSLDLVAKHLDFTIVKTDGASCTQEEFVRGCLVPLFAASFLFTGVAGLLSERRGPAFTTAGAVALFSALHAFAALRRLSRDARQGIRRTVKWAIRSITASALSGTLLGGIYGAGISALTFHLWPDRMRVVVLAGPLVLPAAYTATLILRSAFRRVAPEGYREWVARAQGWLGIGSLAWAALACVGLFGRDLWGAFGAIGTAGLASLTSLLGWTAAALGASRRVPVKRDGGGSRLQDLLGKTVLPAACAAFLALFLSGLAALAAIGVDATSRSFGFASPVSQELAAALVWMLGLGMLGIGAGFFVGINTFSLHSMYGNRLVRAYLGASRWPCAGSDLPSATDRFTGFSAADDLPLISLVENRPYPVVNVALNLVATQRKAWQQRKSESFVLTPLHCGSSSTGFRFSGAYMRYESGAGVSLGRAMTISGAAASPNAGYHSSPVITFLMTLFNLRLGWWAPNPGEVGARAGSLQSNEPRSSALVLLQEACGLTNETFPWVHLSDGGHFENLGLYEMVRRRCHFIVAIDAGCDPERRFEDLGNAIRKIRIDFGIPIEMEGVHVGVPEGPGQTRCAIGRIRYAAVDGEGAPDGMLVYVKPAVLDGDPADVRNFRADHPQFPHETTGDQFFSESQFESYRALGARTIEEIWNESGGTGDATLEEFVSRAAARSARSGATP